MTDGEVWVDVPDDAPGYSTGWDETVPEHYLTEALQQRDEARAEVERLRKGRDRDVQWANKLLVERDYERAQVERLREENFDQAATIQRLREENFDQAATIQRVREPIRCPVHDMPDCSPLLNGCPLVIHITKWRDAALDGGTND